ncbi:MAG: phosphatidylglycerophosphatase A [Endozoicomonadaceae bacterium]|nr:phosphatidylglycerophosphatase A [Endozoicomonadaceae bacterium]MBE8233379.1 phosphatidylglycerophosphatase A [Endozoicomonadaceae bacterium]
MINPNWTFLKHPIHNLACGFGSGLSPAPGTAGSLLAGLLWCWPISQLSTIEYILLLSFCSLLGVWLCGYTSNSLQVSDHPAIVWDEFCGYWLTMLFVPFSLKWGLVGFILFRLFDIFKPWPIHVLERLPGGWGIMADDLAAGILAGIVLQLLIFLM